MSNYKKIVKNNYKWVVLLLMSIVFIVFAIRIKNNPGLGIDNAVYSFIRNFQSDGITYFFKTISNIITIEAICVACIIFLIISFINKYYKYCPFVITNLVFIVILNFILKHIYTRPRPEFMLIDEYGYSFPSGHAMVSMAFYGLFIYIIFHLKLNKYLKYIFSFLIFSLIMLVGISRIYLHVHYFSDVIAGYAVSIIYLVVFTRFMKIVIGEGVKKQPIYKSFYYAISGICEGIKKERNVKIHFIAMLFVIIFGYLLKISLVEWCICVILFGLVISLEYINTAIENAVDLVTTKYDERARVAKDTAAASVFFASIASLIVGLIIFIPKIFY